MVYREPFAIGEDYHCYNRGVDKRTVFESERDYERFSEALYLCNDSKPMERFQMSDETHIAILEKHRDEPLVSIIAYCLMPNHFHLLLRPRVENGLTTFMRKLGTAYTMYFNKKNERVGNLFYKPFRSRHISNDGHYLHIPHYLHLNPVELFERKWKEGILERSHAEIERTLREYRYSSFPEYCGVTRGESNILDMGVVEDWYENPVSPAAIIQEAVEYYSAAKL